MEFPFRYNELLTMFSHSALFFCSLLSLVANEIQYILTQNSWSQAVHAIKITLSAIEHETLLLAQFLGNSFHEMIRIMKWTKRKLFN